MTACCVGSPLAINVDSVMSPFGVTVLMLIIAFHFMAFVIGYGLTGLVFRESPDVKELQRTLSFETGYILLHVINKYLQNIYEN